MALTSAMLTSPSPLTSAAGMRVWPLLPPMMTTSITLLASPIVTILCNERRRRHGLTSHARQRDAIIESIVVNRPGCAWNGHARQIAASGKCPIPYCFDLVGDDNALQSNTVREFATYCVPICFGKNGRKVISWILLRVNKMKI